MIKAIMLICFLFIQKLRLDGTTIAYSLILRKTVYVFEDFHEPPAIFSLPLNGCPTQNYN